MSEDDYQPTEEEIKAERNRTREVHAPPPPPPTEISIKSLTDPRYAKERAAVDNVLAEYDKRAQNTNSSYVGWRECRTPEDFIKDLSKISSLKLKYTPSAASRHCWENFLTVQSKLVDMYRSDRFGEGEDGDNFYRWMPNNKSVFDKVKGQATHKLYVFVTSVSDNQPVPKGRAISHIRRRTQDFPMPTVAPFIHAILHIANGDWKKVEGNSILASHESVTLSFACSHIYKTQTETMDYLKNDGVRIVQTLLAMLTLWRENQSGKQYSEPLKVTVSDIVKQMQKGSSSGGFHTTEIGHYVTDILFLRSVDVKSATIKERSETRVLALDRLANIESVKIETSSSNPVIEYHFPKEVIEFLEDMEMHRSLPLSILRLHPQKDRYAIMFAFILTYCWRYGKRDIQYTQLLQSANIQIGDNPSRTLNIIQTALSTLQKAGLDYEIIPNLKEDCTQPKREIIKESRVVLAPKHDAPQKMIGR